MRFFDDLLLSFEYGNVQVPERVERLHGPPPSQSSAQSRSCSRSGSEPEQKKNLKEFYNWCESQKKEAGLIEVHQVHAVNKQPNSNRFI
mmetsp:Transcript_2705/g.4386  ORF Transcript_2705/g.4386 Transcript_2705/m.4386 type:complete len:89 (-) Transcript_2705:403-669(-)